MKTLVGLFDQYSDAEQAVHVLEEYGVDRSRISLVQREGEKVVDDNMNAGKGAAAGAATGGVVGLLAGMAAVLMNRLVLGIAGFLVGGYLAIKLVELISLNLDAPSWLIFLVGAVCGAVLVAVLFDWALILLTSLLGAGLLVQLLDTSNRLSLVLIAVLVVIGVFIQGRKRLRK